MEIKDILESSGMNPSELARYFNIPPRTVQHWEAGTRKCPPYLLELMVYKLNNEGVTNKCRKPTANIEQMQNVSYEELAEFLNDRLRCEETTTATSAEYPLQWSQAENEKGEV